MRKLLDKDSHLPSIKRSAHVEDRTDSMVLTGIKLENIKQVEMAALGVLPTRPMI